MQEIAGVPRQEFLEVAEEVAKRFIALSDNPKPERTGGYISVLEKAGHKMLLVTELGVCPPEMLQCFDVVQEKVQRLYVYLDKGHVSSWQSRDVENWKYGGGITAPDDSTGVKKGREIIGAVSGLVEHGDEAVTIIIWMVCRWLSYVDAQKIINISENPFFDSLLKACTNLFNRPAYSEY